jgi:hypothetical protein
MRRFTGFTGSLLALLYEEIKVQILHTQEAACAGLLALLAVYLLY